MKNTRKISDAIREIGGANVYEVFSGKVVAINEARTTIDVDIDNGVVIYNVRLKSVVDNEQGMYVIPKLHSFCTIAKRDNGQEYILLQASAIDKLLLHIGQQQLEVTEQGFVFNTGALHGMVKLTELVQQLNALESKVNQIIAWTGTHLHSGGGAGTAPPVPGTLALTQPNQLENPKIKQ